MVDFVNDANLSLIDNALAGQRTPGKVRKTMESIKCRQCNLVTWADHETVSCKRCGGPLWQTNDYGAGFSINGPSDQFLFTGIIKFLTIVLGVAILALLVCRIVPLGDASKIVAVSFILVGVAFAIAMNLWMLAAIFGESVGWGLATLFLPFAGLIALIKFWDKTRRPFVAHLISSGIVVVGFFAVF